MVKFLGRLGKIEERHDRITGLVWRAGKGLGRRSTYSVTPRKADALACPAFRLARCRRDWPIKSWMGILLTLERSLLGSFNRVYSTIVQ